MILIALPLAAADLTGKWNGSAELKTSDGTSDAGSAYAELRQKGQEVTGSAGYDESRVAPIEKVKLDGKKLTFQVTLPGDDGTTVYKVSLTLVSDNRLEGEFEGLRSDGGTMTGKLVFTRQ
jgi:hypothetical protein